MKPGQQNFDKLAYLESIIQNITDVITILEADGTIRYESPSITPILGYLPEEMIGQNAFNFVHPDDTRRVAGLFLPRSSRKTRSRRPSCVSGIRTGTGAIWNAAQRTSSSTRMSAASWSVPAT